MQEINKKNLRNIFLVIAGGIVLYWLLHETDRVKMVVGYITGVLAPFLVGAVIAFILNVPMRSVENTLKAIKAPALRRLVALVIVLIITLLVLAMVFWLLIPQLVQAVETLIPEVIDLFTRLGVRVNDYLLENPEVMEWITANTDLEKIDWPGLVEKALSMVGNSVSTIMTKAFSALGSVFSAVVNMVIALVFALYCLFQKETLARQGRKLIYAFLPEHICDKIVSVLRLSNSTFSNFLSGQCLEVCILGSMFAIAMAIFRMPYIALVSVLVAITAFIPVVGAWIGCIVGAFVILVDNPVLALWFVVMFLVLQQIENNLIYPKVVGTSIGLSGMWVLLAVSIGNALLGVAGMFLMIPVASVVFTLIQQVTNRRLENKQVSPDKLVPQPPELRSHFKMKREKKKKKIAKQIKEKK